MEIPNLEELVNIIVLTKLIEDKILSASLLAKTEIIIDQNKYQNY